MNAVIAAGDEICGVHALEHALLAFESAWLLDPDEAATLWLDGLCCQGWKTVK
ncbi:MAG: hypothetical protein ABI702_01900 [Burkholderiales bacterium]